MVQAAGNVAHNLRTISSIAAHNQDSDIRIVSEVNGSSTTIKPVKAERSWFGWFCSLFGFEVSREDVSGSSKQFISAFRDNYGDIGSTVIDEYGLKEGKALLGRDVAHVIHKADSLLRQKSEPLDRYRLLEEPFFQDITRRMDVSLERVRDAYVKVLEGKQAALGNAVSVYNMGAVKQRGFLIEALKGMDGKCTYGEALLQRIESLNDRDFGKEPLLPSEYKSMLAMAIKEHLHDDTRKKVVENLKEQLTSFSAFMRDVREESPDWDSDRARLRLGAGREVFQSACVEVFLKEHAQKADAGALNSASLKNEAYQRAEARWNRTVAG